MNLQELQYFKVLAQEKHYTRAARLLCITQPALSYAISELEKDLGVPLFIKLGHKTELSSPGKLFLDYVNRSLDELDRGVKAVRDVNSVLKGVVKVAAIPSFNNSLLPTIIKAFYKNNENENIRFVFSKGVNSDLVDALQAGTVDVAFCSDPPKSLKSFLVYRQGIILITPKDNPLGNFREISIQQLGATPLVLVNSRSGLRSRINQIFKEEKYHPNIAFEVDECSAVVAFVRNGLGAGIISKDAHMTVKGFNVVPFARKYTRSVYLAWLGTKVMSPAVKAFSDFVLSYFDGRHMNDFYVNKG